MNLFGKYFKTSLLFISLALILSFVAYFFPLFNKVAFFVILCLTLILTLEKLEYGLYILLAELFIGSKGYLFYFDSGSVSVSLRIALFLVVMSVWLTKWVIAKKKSPLHPPFSKGELKGDLMKWYWILFVFIAWGFVWGIVRGNSFQNVFFDFNSWLYFAMIFPITDVIKSRAEIENILQIFIAAVAIIVVKTIFLLYIFSHNLEVAMYPLYRWLRQFLIGEITLMDSGFYRIFFQSQIYVLIGFFILVAFLIWRRHDVIARSETTKQSPVDEIAALPAVARNDRKMVISYLLLIIGSLSSILISFSRSFWVGLAFGLLALLAFLIIYKFSFKKILKTGLCGLAILLVSVAAILITVKFPYPTPEKISWGSMLEERLTDLSEAAVRSRWDLLPPLGLAIVKHPVIGSGFGTTVTYKSSDPRAIQLSPYGKFTTYAFEWGYLDIMLKIGLAGLVVYLLLIAKIWRSGWHLWRVGEFITPGLLLGISALLATNFFSPYLNHPLGIGYLILCSTIFQKLK
jgi:O-antigen ligase